VLACQPPTLASVSARSGAAVACSASERASLVSARAPAAVAACSAVSAGAGAAAAPGGGLTGRRVVRRSRPPGRAGAPDMRWREGAVGTAACAAPSRCTRAGAATGTRTGWWHFTQASASALSRQQHAISDSVWAPTHCA
jgi:hypothetical protein